MAPRRPSAPPDSVAGRRQKSLPPASLFAFRPRRQKQGPLRGGFHWGKPQTPAIMPWLTPGHLPRPPQPSVGRPLPPHKAGSAEYPLGPQPVPQTPRARHLGCVVRSPAPAAGWQQSQSRGSSSQRRPSRLAARRVLSVPLLWPSHTTSTRLARFTISALRTWVAAVGPWAA